MKERKDSVLVLCDREEEYAHLMTEYIREYIRKHGERLWNVHTYTDVEELLREEKNRSIDVMVVAERTYQDRLRALQPLRTIILNESGLLKLDEFVNVDKYQQAQDVLQSILEVYLEIADVEVPRIQGNGNTRLIGIYSPVRRCMQTTFALTMGQLIGEKYRTLYLNFEHYVGISELAAETGARDLADLLYFLMAEKEKFRLRLQTIVRHKGSLDYVPPMKSGQNLLSVPPKEWMRFLQRIEELGEYDYVIMDLSESMQGLFDLLRSCSKVFTLTKEDRIAQGKLAEYERILGAYAYEDVLVKTCKCTPPQVRRIPEELEQYTKGEMADYVRGLLGEICGDRG
ncbi:MAG: hypothetical protein NC399_03800 [Muribaculum sp.]|nr:hypothetical protein [Muribaculum sp.]